MYIITTEWPRFFSYKKPAFWLILPFYPLLPLVLIIALQAEAGPSLTLFLCVSVACFDMGSYVAGKVLGSHKIWSRVSPGKTWEGFIGGYLATLIFIFMVSSQSGSLLFIMLFTLALACSALLGDLFESILKRQAGIKDSGALLPGHGGLLDRLDSLLFAVGLVYPMRDYLIKLVKL